MRRRVSRKVPRFASLSVCSVLALGCTEKSERSGETTATDQGTTQGAGGGAGGAATPPGPDGRPPMLATVLAHDKGVVFGHFLVPDGAQLLREAKERLMIPAYKGFLDEPALRSLASLQLPEKNKPLAQNIDIAAPFGCVLVDFKAYDKAPVACTFGYKGGAAQLVADLGDADKQPDAGKHAAKYRFEGSDVFVDALGEHVVVSAYDDLFGKTSGYLENNLIRRAASVRGDFEVVGYVSDAFEFYRADIQPFLDEYAKMQQPTPAGSGNAGIDDAVAVWTDYNKKSTEQTIQSFSEMAQVTFHLGVESIGIVGGVTIVPAAGSKLEATSRRSGGNRVDPKLPGSAPKGTMMLAAAATRPEALDDPTAVELRKAAAQSWAALTHQDAAQAERSLADFVTEYRDLYSGQSLLAVVDVEGAPLAGILFAANLRPGKSARDSFHGFAKRFTPDAVLGREFSQYVNWKLEVGATRLEGIEVDRFTLEPTDAARALLDKEMSDEDRKQVDRWFGGVRLIAHRAELEGRVIWTLAPKAEEAFTKQVVAAQQGRDALGPDAGTQRMLDYEPAASAVFGVDVHGTLGWLRGFEELAGEMTEVPTDLGHDLSDVFVVLQNRSDGVFVGELVISQPLIDQLKAVAAKQAG